MKRPLPLDFTLRQLSEDDWAAYAALRLRALRECPGVYGSRYELECDCTEAEWRALFTKKDNFAFGLFYENSLVAFQAIASRHDDPSLAMIWGSYIAPEHRGKGLFHALYEACIEAGEAYAPWKKVTVSHRGDNEASKRVILGAGFAFSYLSSRTWPDGETVEEPWYEFDLEKGRTCEPHRALPCLKGSPPSC